MSRPMDAQGLEQEGLPTWAIVGRRAERAAYMGDRRTASFETETSTVEDTGRRKEPL